MSITYPLSTMDTPTPRQLRELLRVVTPRKWWPTAVSPHKYPADVIEHIASFMSIDDFRNFRLVNGTIHDATVSLFARRYFRHITFEFTFDGLNRLLEIISHSDITGEICFGRMLRCRSITQAVWSKNEGAEWWRQYELTTKGSQVEYATTYDYEERQQWKARDATTYEERQQLKARAVMRRSCGRGIKTCLHMDSMR